MTNLGSLLAFCAASLALVVVPGPAVVYIVTRSIDQGRTAGLVSALGIATGGLVHVLAAAVGLSALLMSSATAYEFVRFAGAAYLIFLGVKRLVTRDDVVAADPGTGAVGEAATEARSCPRWSGRSNCDASTAGESWSTSSIRRRRCSSSPSSRSSRRTTGAPRAGQIAGLGLLFVAIALASDSTYALVASHLGGVLRHSRTWEVVRRWWSGTIYVVLGVFTAVSGHRPTT